MNSRDCQPSWFQIRRKRLESVTFTTALVTVWAVVVITGVTAITHP
ncbi:hypothetical protein ACH4TV_04810 [Streptomyces sp. NPDC020898]